MSPLATVILAWSAVYGYVCAYYLLLFLRRRADREYLTFGLMAGALCLYAIANEIMLDAASAAERRVGLQLAGVGLLALIPFYTDFAVQLTGERNRLAAVAYVWSAIGVVALAFGLDSGTVSSSNPVPRELPWGRVALDPRVEPVGYAYLGIGWAFAVLATLRLFPVARLDRDVRIILIAAIVNLVAGTHDLVVRSMRLGGMMLLEHTAMCSVLAMSYVLLDRFARTANSLMHRTAELSRSYHELRTTQEELVRKEQLAAVGELSAVIAHEVRNPLAIIKNAVSGLRRPTIRSADHDTLLSILDEETDKLNRLMHDLLAYARPVVPKGRSLSVSDLVRRSVERARTGTPHASSIDVEIDLDEAAPDIHGDPELLRHALVNVVDNAMQAMPSGGRLTIEAKDTRIGEHPAVTLIFSDTGEGMDTIVREKARDPFFTTRPSGTGLGLAIVERVIANHGGRVDIASRHGEGTTVSITLPQEHISILPIPPPEAVSGRLSGIRGGS